MVILKNVNKYYNKGRSNQIHVINDTTLKLPDRGIFCILGPSGCGKTTLLNTIGGLDRVDSGSISIDGQVITGSTSDRIDNIRNAKVGYIFQNFNLLDNRTVSENVSIALRIAGITDEEMIRSRVNYCLDKVGMYRYRNKKARALSGGQRQRVAIARAIAGDPSIIIADEPTGNLDSANTLEIMNLIKAVSREKLIILVTHERRLAEFYADHIAEMEDGRIVSVRNNDSSGYLDYQLENRIYLRDMPVAHHFREGGINVDLYSDSERDTNVTVVIRNGNIYIDTDANLNVVDESANIEIIDDHYRAMDESFMDGSDFDYRAFLPEQRTYSYAPVYSLGGMIRIGWETVQNYGFIRKVLMIGFVFAAMFAFLALSNLAGIADVQPEDYRTTSGNYLTIPNATGTEDLPELLDSLESVGYVLPGDTRISVTMQLDDFLQTYSAAEDINVSLALTSVLDRDQIIYGKMPSDSRDVVIDMMAAIQFLREDKGRTVGLNTADAFTGRMIYVPGIGEYTITGVSDTGSPSLYVDEGQAMYILTNANDPVRGNSGDETDDQAAKDLIRSGKVRDIALAPDDLRVTDGSVPKKPYEVLISETGSRDHRIGSYLKTRMGDERLRVCGYYKGGSAFGDVYFVSEETVRKYYYSRQREFTVYAPDLNLTRSLFDSQGLGYTVNDERDRKIYIREHREQLISALMAAGIVLFVSLIEMYLMLRSSFLSRIREIGILRAIGLKKADICRMFTGEILVISVVTAVPGIAAMYLIMSCLTGSMYYMEGAYMITPAIASCALAIVILFDLLAGILPVYVTLRKTSAQILSRTDV